VSSESSQVEFEPYYAPRTDTWLTRVPRGSTFITFIRPGSRRQKKSDSSAKQVKRTQYDN